MKKSRLSDEQIVKILSSVTHGVTVSEVCQSHGVSENTFYTWKRKYAGMESHDIRMLKDLQSENQALKQIVADLCQEKGIRANTFYVWKRKFGALQTNDVKRLGEPQQSLGP